MMRSRTWSLGNGGTASWSRESSVAQSVGSTEAWLETICPILT